MPTARELLEQTDAMMRRNRAREHAADIPELTDEVAVAHRARPAPGPAPASPPALRKRPVDDVPELNDVVEELSIQPLPPEDDEDVSRWLEHDLGEASITGPAPDTLAVVPPATLDSPPPAPPAAAAPTRAVEERGAPAPVPPTATAALAAKVAGTLTGPPAEPPPASDPGFEAMLGMTPAEAVAAPPATTIPPDDARFSGLAEEIRMQVLQRIDIFTDTGLHGELAARLQPIVDRASADLLTTINREVGQILRAYVAEAIEREIEKWREENP